MKQSSSRSSSLNLAAAFAFAAGIALTFGIHALSEDAFGGTLKDGTVHAGTSIATTPEDAPGRYTFDGAIAYCDGLSAHGREDWRLPSKLELNVLFNNQSGISGFSDNGYWSSTEYNEDGSNYWVSEDYNPTNAWGQNFKYGYQSYVDHDNEYNVRCVRHRQLSNDL